MDAEYLLTEEELAHIDPQGIDHGYDLLVDFRRPEHPGPAYVYNTLNDLIEYLKDKPEAKELIDRAQKSLDCIVLANPTN